MTDHIIKAAREAGFAGWKCDEAKIQRLYAIAFQHGMERAAEIADESLTWALRGDEISDRILAEAHAQNPPKNEHDGGDL